MLRGEHWQNAQRWECLATTAQAELLALQQVEPNLLSWVSQGLHSTETSSLRHRLVSSQAIFQDFVLTLATAEENSDIRRLAGAVMMRCKLLQGEEEAYLARLTRRSQDSHVQSLADEVGKLRTALACVSPAEPGALDKALEAQRSAGREPARSR